MSKTIGALWKPVKKSDNGPVLYGTIELIAGFPQQVAIFPNTKKTKENQPDLNIVLNESKEDSKKTQPKEQKSYDF